MKKNIIYTIFFTFFTSSLLSCADGNVNQANESALFNAVCTKKLYEVRMVLSTLAKHPKGRAASLALINQHNQEGNTALISAVDNRSLSIVQALMQAG
ncbi:MAG TPA: ankyrin repeat domain-containing protein, partial [Candidatus Saccharimonadales bacterium]|nr:ankyrin repeat domain-containing protein [Candidatus Saccharimonadales bacterium]